jgi:hypothetical protein
MGMSDYSEGEQDKWMKKSGWVCALIILIYFKFIINNINLNFKLKMIG